MCNLSLTTFLSPHLMIQIILLIMSMHHVMFYNIKYGKKISKKLLIIVRDIIFSHVVMLFVPMANNAYVP